MRFQTIAGYPVVKVRAGLYSCNGVEIRSSQPGIWSMVDPKSGNPVVLPTLAQCVTSLKGGPR